jgi:hypothetical protein
MPFTVTTKPGVVLTGLQAAGFQEIGALLYAASLCDSSLVITCGLEGHPPNDPHTRGEALDVSVHGFAPALIRALHDALATYLGPAFTVLFEAPELPADPDLQHLVYLNKAASGPHLHLQPRKGTVWPPPAPGTASAGESRDA